MAKPGGWVSIRGAIDLLAEVWGQEEAISELFSALEEGSVKADAAAWTIGFDFPGQWVSGEEMDHIENGAKAEFWRFMRDQFLGGPTDGIVKRQSLNRGMFDVIIRYGSVAEAHHEISGLVLHLKGVRGLLKSVNIAVPRQTKNPTEQQAVQKAIGRGDLMSFVSGLRVDVEINRSDVLALAKQKYPDSHIPRQWVRDAVNAEFGRGTPGPKKRQN